MKTTAKLNNLRIAPRKVRLIADVIRNKKIEEARAILNFSIKKGSLPLLKLLNSAVSNASSAFQLNADNLYISKITVDEGRKLKRWMPRARGSAARIEKKTSHITLILEEIKPTKAVKKKKSVSKAKSLEQGDEKNEKREDSKKFQPGGRRERMNQEAVRTNDSRNRGSRIFRRKSI